MSGEFKLLDVETEAEVEITADYDLLRRYGQALRLWRKQIRQFCSARHMHYVPIETSLPFDDLVLSLLRHRGVLG